MPSRGYAASWVDRRILLVGARAPPARSSVTATVEPTSTGRVSRTTVLPPPAKRPAGWGAPPWITQISYALPGGAAGSPVTVSRATPPATASDIACLFDEPPPDS